ncbi:MAG: type IX secretion system membrane protein PorP/SprF [Cytophagales bacterium]|nr:MAG: type IX secretion system membrane protein PorP/SprF [Cytophagales bacterium]
MKKHKLFNSLLSILVGLLLSSIVTAQDIQFSQFYAVPIYLNPAFAGSAHNTRGILHQRLQWPSLAGKFTTSLFSLDGFSHKYRSGFGLMAIQDYQGASVISSSQVGLQYAYELHLSPKYTVRAGLSGDFLSRYLNYSSLRFPTQFNDSSGFNGLSNNFNNPRRNMASVGSGLLLYSKKFWFSSAAHHMNFPNQSFVGEISRLPMKVSFTAGYKIPLKKSKQMAYLEEEETDISITPTAHYKFQGKSDQLDIGLYGIYDKIIVAVWYRGIPLKNYDRRLPNNESMVVIAGFMLGSFSFTYSYDFTVSKLAQSRTGGSHEMNITYLHKHKPKTVKPMRRLPCPNFYKSNKNLKPHHDLRPSSGHPHIN